MKKLIRICVWMGIAALPMYFTACKKSVDTTGGGSGDTTVITPATFDINTIMDTYESVAHL